MSPPKDVTVTIDGIQLSVPNGMLLVEAAKKLQRDIPVYCYHPKLGPAGLCRVCLVEIEKTPKLQIACNTPVTDGMVVHTMSDKAMEGRRAILEFLLLNHPLDCPICDKGGECDLQDFSMAYGQGASRLVDAKMAKPKAVDLGPTIVLDEERCILCLRCVRFDDIITQEQSLRTEDRGAGEIIATATDAPYHSDFSGNVTELCPVGALTSKTYRFKSRPWDLNRTKTTCLQCSVGCQLNVDERHGSVLRTMSVPDDDAISDGWLCDRGRYNVGFYDDARRVTSPLYRQRGTLEWNQIGWDDAISLWGKSLKDAGPEAVAALGGGRLLNEEAFLLQHVYRAFGARHLDWRTGRQRIALQPQAGTLSDLETAEVIITYGRSAEQLAPIMDLRIRKAVSQHRAKLLVLGAQPAHGVVASAHVASVAELEAALPTSYTRIAILWDGADGGLDESFAQWCIAQRDTQKKTVFAYIVGEQSNARGAEAMGMLPRNGGLDARGIFAAALDGRLQSLAILGANPLLSFPDRQLVEDALWKLPFLVVSELFLTETAARATLVLPARGPFEKAGTTTNLTGERLIVRAGLAPPSGTLSDGEMLVALAAELGIDIPTPAEIQTQVQTLSNSLRHADESKEEYAVPPLGGGLMASLRLVIGADMFAGGGTAQFDDGLRELRPAPAATLAPRTAAALEVRSGDCIDLVAGDRALHDLIVRVDDRAAEGTVSIIDGLAAAPANALRSGEHVAVANIRSAPALVGSLR